MIDISISDKHLTAMFADCGASYSCNAMLLSEEMSELNKEIMKFDRLMRENKGCYGIGVYSRSKDAITEEMAHVYICLEAMKKLVGISNEEIQEKIQAKEHGNKA